MDLWVRTQDKKFLLKINNGLKIRKIFLRDDEVFIIETIGNETTNRTLGQYKSEKRAFEVLDEIQNKLKCEKIIKVKDSIISKETISNIQKLLKKGYVAIDDTVDVEQGVCNIYEMPKE